MDSVPLSNRIRAIAGKFQRRLVLLQRKLLIRRAKSACRRTQHKVLRRLLRLNSGSQFSRDFGLSPGMSLEEFRRRIPVSGYELIRPYVDRVRNGEHSALLGRRNRLVMFAVTSGTTSESKLIPITRRFVRDYRRGWQAWGIGIYQKYPAVQQLNIIQISSSHRRFFSPDGTPCGNISGLVAAMQKRIVRSMYSVPAAVAEIQHPESRRYCVLRFAAADRFVGILITANPGTILQMADELRQHAGDLIRDIADGGIKGATLSGDETRSLSRFLKPNRERARQLEEIMAAQGALVPSAVWPFMKTLGVWRGGSAAAYIPRVQQCFPSVMIRDHGLHASEGRMTLPLDDQTSAGLLEVQTHFFEFLPVAESESAAPVILEAHELQEGGDYYILLTTSSGLYRYNIQDVVRCVGFLGETPLLEFRHKGAHIASITGEKLAESHVVEAVQRSAADCGVYLKQFTLTPEWSDPPGYTLFVDPAESLEMRSTLPVRLASAVDQALQLLNLEYREKRETGRLRPVSCEPISVEQWRNFTRSRMARSGGSSEQYKHPCLLPDPEFQQLFRSGCGPVQSTGCSDVTGSSRPPLRLR